MADDIEEIPPRGGDNQQLLLYGGAAAFLLVLLALTIALVMLFSLSGDVTALQEQAHRSAKATQALQAEIADLRKQAETLAATRRTESQQQPQNIDAADPSSDCVIRPGSKSGLADCIKLAPK